jgi:hypothetical protein
MLICFILVCPVPAQSTISSPFSLKTIGYIALGYTIKVSTKKVIHYIKSKYTKKEHKASAFYQFAQIDKSLPISLLDTTLTILAHAALPLGQSIAVLIGMDVANLQFSLFKHKKNQYQQSSYCLRSVALVSYGAAMTCMQNALQSKTQHMSIIQSCKSLYQYASVALSMIQNTCDDYILPIPPVPGWTDTSRHNHKDILFRIKNDTSDYAKIIQDAPGNWIKKGIYQTIHHEERKHAELQRQARLPRTIARLVGNITSRCTIPLA